jgi:hypothetical protein
MRQGVVHEQKTGKPGVMKLFSFLSKIKTLVPRGNQFSRDRKNLREKMKFLLEETLKKAPGQIDKASVDKLEYMQTLLTLSNPYARKRYKLLTIFLTISGLIVITTFSFIRIPVMEVDIEIQSRTINFTLPGKPQMMLDWVALDSLQINGITGVEIPATPKVDDFYYTANQTSAGKGLPVIVRSIPGEENTEPMTLHLASPVSGAQITLSRTEEPDMVKMTIKTGDTEFIIDAAHTIEFELFTVVHKVLDFSGYPGSLLLKSQDQQGEIYLELHEDSGLTIADCLMISGLSFMEPDNYQFLDKPSIYRQLPGIQSGSVIVTSMLNKKITLFARDSLEFKKIDGMFRELYYKNGLFHIQLTGKIRGATLGKGMSKRSIMPTLLEWVTAHNRITLFWTAFIYLLTLGFNLIKWIKK